MLGCYLCMNYLVEESTSQAKFDDLSYVVHSKTSIDSIYGHQKNIVRGDHADAYREYRKRRSSTNSDARQPARGSVKLVA